MDKKYVLVSGANGGIGSRIVRYLIDNGYSPICLDVSSNRIDSYDVPFIKCDISNKEDLKKAFEDIKEITPKLYAIINSAAIFKMQSIIEGDEDDFRKIFDINFFGIYSLNKIMFPLLQEGSKIINITSEVAKYTSQPFEGYYTLSKTALDNYSDVLRRECNYLGIKVIKIQSGSMATPLLKAADDSYHQMVDSSSHFKEPLTKLKHIMDKELKKTNNPDLIGKLIIKILKKKKPKIIYRIKNSFALSLLGHLPEKMQDSIYLKVIK